MITMLQANGLTVSVVLPVTTNLDSFVSLAISQSGTMHQQVWGLPLKKRNLSWEEKCQSCYLLKAWMYKAKHIITIELL